MKRWIGHLLDSFQRAHKAGVRVAAGNDGSTRDWVHVGDMAGEIEAMVQYGMAPHDALIAATANASELLQLPDEGVIGQGKRANLVVLNKDPLADIRALSKPVTVMKDGIWVTGESDEYP
jgi:imidazolonepropionase-like amidohydrolase